MTSEELQTLLLRRAEPLRRYVEGKIPKRHRSVLCAEDVLQEVWIAAYQALSDELRDVDHWLTTVVNSKLIDALRIVQAIKRGRGLAAVRDRPSRASSVDSLLTRLCAHAKTPSSDLSAQEARDAVRVALAGLAPEARRAVQLRYIEGLSHQAIAQLMRKSKPAVNSLLFRGLRELQERMGAATRFFSDARLSGGPDEGRPRPRDRERTDGKQQPRPERTERMLAGPD